MPFPYRLKEMLPVSLFHSKTLLSTTEGYKALHSALPPNIPTSLGLLGFRMCVYPICVIVIS